MRKRNEVGRALLLLVQVVCPVWNSERKLPDFVGCDSTKYFLNFLFNADKISLKRLLNIGHF